MKRKHLRTLHAIITDFMGLHEGIEHDDNYLLHTIRAHDAKTAHELSRVLDTLHRKVKENLKAAKHTTEVYMQHNKGLLPLQLEELFDKVKYFPQKVLYPKGNERFMLAWTAKKCEGECKKAVEAQLEKIEQLRHTSHYKSVLNELERLEKKKESYSYGYDITLRRAKTKQTFNNNNRRVHVHVFFDEHLWQMKVRSAIDFFFFRIESVLEHAQKSGILDESGKRRLLENVQKAGALYQDMSIYDIQKRFTDMIARVCGEVMMYNQDLFLSPSIEVQVRIQEDEPTLLACDTEDSTIDLYLLKARFLALLMIDAVVGDVHTTIDLQFAKFLLRNLSSEGDLMHHTWPKEHSYRVLSFYNAIAHELEHARDQTQIQNAKEDVNLFNVLLKKANQDPEESSRTAFLMRIVKTLRDIRNEAPSQLKEIIAKYKEQYADSRIVPLNMTHAESEKLQKDLEAIVRDENEKLESNKKYIAAYIAAITILLADLYKKGMDPIILDSHGMERFTETMKREMSSSQLMTALQNNDTKEIRKHLKSKDIPTRSITRVSGFLHRDHMLYLLLGHPRESEVTLQKIRKMDEKDFIEAYFEASEHLGLRDTFISSEQLQHLTTLSRKNLKKRLKKAGFMA